MTEFEKELKPIEDWIEKMLKGRLPYDREIDVFFCAALIKQYQIEQLNIPIVRKSFFTRLKVMYFGFYYKCFLAESKYRFKNKPNTLKLAKRFYRYKMYLLNK